MNVGNGETGMPLICTCSFLTIHHRDLKNLYDSPFVPYTLTKSVGESKFESLKPTFFSNLLNIPWQKVEFLVHEKLKRNLVEMKSIILE